MGTEAARSPAILMSSGREALAHGAWAEARARFESALALEESPDALEGLGTAASWQDDAATTFGARERAFRLYRERGDDRSAARVAMWLSMDYLEFRGETAVANGWLQRAERLLEGLEPSAEHGWLRLLHAHNALLAEHDTGAARRLCAEAAAIGRAVDAIDVEMLALALEGLALVSEGDIANGMRRLDESTAAATGGELTNYNAVGTACCYLIQACERVRDFERAAQWCERAQEMCRRWQVKMPLAVCRAQYGMVLVSRGEWAAAEAELQAAMRQAEVSRPPLVRTGLVRLAELRRRQGRWDEAADFFARVSTHRLAVLGRAALNLDQGDPAGAADLLEPVLERVPRENRTERVAALELAARARAAQGDRQGAEAAVAELEETARAIATRPLRAAAAMAAGLVAVSAGDFQRARSRLEEAVGLFDEAGQPFELAQARIELAGTLLALHRPAAARAEAALAARALRTIGASWEAQRAEALATAPERDRTTGPLGRGPRLTRRELEVLRLVAQGLPDKQIAGRLGLSEHTVHRHVANIFTKTGVGSRAAAVAAAGKQGLL